MFLLEFVAEDGADLRADGDELGEGLAEGGEVEGTGWAELVVLAPVVFPFFAAGGAFGGFALRAAEVVVALYLLDFFRPVFPVAVAVDVILGQAEQLEGLD